MIVAGRGLEWVGVKRVLWVFSYCLFFAVGLLVGLEFVDRVRVG